MSERFLPSLAGLRLAFFDVDGTLKLERDPYMALHRWAGTAEQGAALLAAFRRGEFDYHEFARRDPALWAGLPAAEADACFAALPWAPPARALAETLRIAGVALILVSSGLDRHVRQVAEAIGAEAWVANELEVAGGVLTGRMTVNVTWDGKGEVVCRLQRERGVGPESCLAVGDGPGDLGMFAACGLRIAANPASDAVSSAADFVLGEGDVLEWLETRLGGRRAEA